MDTTSFSTPMNRGATYGVGASQALSAFSDPRTIGRSSEIVRETSVVRIPEALFIGENSQGSSYLLRRLQEKGFQCYFASTAENALSLFQAHRFDLAFCPIRLRDASLYFLLDLLDGSIATLYYFYPVEDGCWWLPAIRRGKRCWGTSALRSSEFVLTLEAAMDEARLGL